MESNAPVAIITGGSRGIGLETARLLASGGYRTVLVGRNRDSLAAAARELPGALTIAADLSDSSQPDEIVRRTLDWAGRIDALINNAGDAPMLSMAATTPEIFRRLIELNLTSAFSLSRACWPVFTAQKRGVIVNISSVSADDPLPGFIAYAASKGGLNSLTRAMAREGVPYNIRVHAVAPGAVETELFRSLVDESTWPASRTLAPVDVARTIVACVDGDLKFTSGSIINVQREAK